MKGKIRISIIIFALVLMISSVSADEPAASHPADAMWVEPSTIELSTDTVSVGHRFNVTVWVNVTATSASWQFQLAYNKNHLNAIDCDYTNATAGKSDFFENITTIALTPTFASLNSTHNYVLHGETWGLSGPFRSPGYGSLAWVEFNVTAVPPEGEAWTSKLAFNEVYPDGTETYVQDSEQTKIPLNVYQSTYTIPEFPFFASLMLVIGLTIVAMLSRKLRSYISCK